MGGPLCRASHRLRRVEKAVALTAGEAALAAGVPAGAVVLPRDAVRVEEHPDVRLTRRRQTELVGAERRARAVAEKSRADVVHEVILARIAAVERTIRERREILANRRDARL